MLTSSDVLNRSFTSTSFRRGYDELEVDEFLDELVETLRYYERGGQPPRGVPASHVLPDPKPPLEDPTPTGQRASEDQGPSDPEPLEPPASPVGDGPGTPAPSALPVVVSPTSRKYIERAQRASRWLREDPLP
ncbi:DivIVA domain-containing protein [Monashia sp. NPDC004114]